MPKLNAISVIEKEGCLPLQTARFKKCSICRIQVHTKYKGIRKVWRRHDWVDEKVTTRDCWMIYDTRTATRSPYAYDWIRLYWYYCESTDCTMRTRPCMPSSVVIASRPMSPIVSSRKRCGGTHWMSCNRTVPFAEYRLWEVAAISFSKDQNIKQRAKQQRFRESDCKAILINVGMSDPG